MEYWNVKAAENLDSSTIRISTKFLGILDRVREAIPHAAITTDIIVGFPGETDKDFAETMRIVANGASDAAPRQNRTAAACASLA
jgi:biotin synthase-related radical SAM superfamily protein